MKYNEIHNTKLLYVLIRVYKVQHTTNCIDIYGTNKTFKRMLNISLYLKSGYGCSLCFIYSNVHRILSRTPYRFSISKHMRMIQVTMCKTHSIGSTNTFYDISYMYKISQLIIHLEYL